MSEQQDFETPRRLVIQRNADAMKRLEPMSDWKAIHKLAAEIQEAAFALEQYRLEHTHAPTV